MKNAMKSRFVVWFEDLGIKDIPIVGGKNASLGEMIRQLSKEGVSVPGGFAITAEGYRHILKKSGIGARIREVLSDLNVHDMKNLAERGEKVRKIIREAEIPEDLRKEISAAYKEMERRYGQNPDVAVRSSATAEDLPGASFAGQQETFLNVSGEEALLESCKSCFASLFTDRAISYREDKGFGHFNVYLSIGVQKMIRSDLACSGVMFTIDTESGFRDVVFITGSYGLGENVVQGAVNPDEFYVFKPTLKQGKKPIITRNLGTKKLRMIYDAKALDAKRKVRNIDTTAAERGRFVISDSEVLQLAKWACIIEDHYKKAMDIEWAKDGKTGKLFIVQARPETVCSARNRNFIETYVLKGKGRILAEGGAVGEKIGQGKANRIMSAKDLGKFRAGEVLVTDMTDPDWEPIMKIASAIVTNRGGRTAHAAIVSRELGIPCVIGTENASEKIKTGQKITVVCSDGERGKIYEGLLKYEVKKLDLNKLPKTKTKILMNVGMPENAFVQGQLPSDGVGLAREEFIINSYIGIHPLALLNYRKLAVEAKKNPKVREIIKQIDAKTAGFSDKKEFFIQKLAEGVGRIAAGFYPRDVIVRLSDFKSNEYANLTGGVLYEPEESNPMIGWRGASRYYDPKFEPAFALECEALRRVRDDMGLTNVKAMIPFCRTVEEGKKVIKTMRKHGLKQGKNGLEVYVMCEIPSNVILADQFCKVFDGFSIGSNDLTQLTLGLDRDSALVAHVYDERNEAVKRLLKSVIQTAKKNKKKVGICGQAPSDYPEFAEFLVECGIDSISLNPDTVIKTRLIVAKKEKALGRR